MLAMEARTWPERRMASSTPTAVRSAIPMTSARPRDRSAPDPRRIPSSLLTSCPSGNSEPRMSSSVTDGPPHRIGKSNELIGGQVRNRASPRNALGFPNFDRIPASAKALQPVFEARLLGLQRTKAEVCGGRRQLQRSAAKILHGIFGEGVRTAE